MGERITAAQMRALKLVQAGGIWRDGGRWVSSDRKNYGIACYNLVDKGLIVVPGNTNVAQITAEARKLLEGE